MPLEQHYIDKLMLPFDLHALEAQLRSVHVAEVRLHAKPKQETFDQEGAAIVETFRSAMEVRRTFDRMTREVLQVKDLADADPFLDDEARASMLRIADLMRTWAPRWASLRVPETAPVTQAFSAFCREYNDTVTRLVRALLDCASAFEKRVADEIAEDAEADDWTARNPNWQDNDEDLVPWDEVLARLYPNEVRSVQ